MSHDNGSADNSSADNGRAPIAVANAPVSYGAFELTVGSDPDVPDGHSVLSQVAAIGALLLSTLPLSWLISPSSQWDCPAGRRGGGCR